MYGLGTLSLTRPLQRFVMPDLAVSTRTDEARECRDLRFVNWSRVPLTAVGVHDTSNLNSQILKRGRECS